MTTARKKQLPQEAPYRGLLAKPMPWVSKQLDFNAQAWWFDGTLDDWQRHVANVQHVDWVRFRECVMLLYQHFDIDPRKDGAELDLALALAKRHVPAFQEQTKRRGRPTELNPADTVKFLLECHRLQQQMHRDVGKQPSLRDLAEKVHRSPFCKSRRLSAETIRRLLRQLKTAKTAFKAGKATEFQRNFCEVVSPMLESAAPRPRKQPAVRA